MDWQPIETAPKDQRNILVCDGGVGVEDFDGFVAVALWTEKHAGHIANDEFVWADWNAGLDEFDTWRTVGFNPTHWMPLPEPPIQPNDWRYYTYHTQA